MENEDCREGFAKVTEWKGEKAVCFGAGGYEALIIPSVGGNLIQLKNVQKGLDLLRTPDDLDAFKARPQVYGIPVLFPPNRIEDGVFEAAGKVYNFPVNEPNSNHNHIHGLLRTKPFEVAKMESAHDRAEVEVVFHADSSTDFYTYFPHEFDFKMNYILSIMGLEQTVTIVNKSGSPMPMGLGFHTAFRIPFCTKGSAKDCSMIVSAGEEWELGPRMLPTGKISPLGARDMDYREDGVYTQGFPISGHYTSKEINYNGREFHGAVIEDKSNGLKLVYEVGKGYKHWMIWNETGDKGFICPEPQTWAVNAPNIKLPHEVTGFMALLPGETWEDKCKIYVK